MTKLTSSTRTTQEFPYPAELFELVDRLCYKGWTFNLGDIDRGQGSKGLTLDIVTLGRDSYHPERGETYCVHHYMPVPPAAYNRQSWTLPAEDAPHDADYSGDGGG